VGRNNPCNRGKNFPAQLGGQYLALQGGCQAAKENVAGKMQEIATLRKLRCISLPMLTTPVTVACRPECSASCYTH
jgi:hypothetical protein